MFTLLLEELGWIPEWKMMCDVFAAVSVVLQDIGLQVQIVQGSEGLWWKSQGTDLQKLAALYKLNNYYKYFKT